MCDIQFFGIYNRMFVSKIWKILISAPTISSDMGVFIYVVLYKGIEAYSRSIWYNAKSDTANSFASWGYLAFVFNGNCYQAFFVCSTTSLTRAFTTNISLVYFDSPRQVVSPWPYHSYSKLMQPSPRGMITPQTQNSLKTQSIGAIFLVCDMPHCFKPEPQGLSCIVKKGSSSNRGLPQAMFALKQPSCCSASFAAATHGAGNSIRPPEANEIVNTGFFCRETISEVSKVYWEILHNP
jgi:hypothetical protein